MPNEFFQIISEYGYLSIFLLILAQEVGLPSPIPNEFLLLFSGYLIFMGALNLLLVVIAVVSADFLAGTILYGIFYYFGNTLLKNKPKWLPLPEKKIQKVSEKIQKDSQSSVFVGRLTPLIRGYVSVACGLFQLSNKKYFSILISASILWALIYIVAGFFIGPYWEFIINNYAKNSEYYFVLIAGILIIVTTLFYLFKKYILKVD
jgi:membrane protein DedA with SNARE-associated domain